jgi:hypothetical protein
MRERESQAAKKAASSNWRVSRIAGEICAWARVLRWETAVVAVSASWMAGGKIGSKFLAAILACAAESNVVDNLTFCLGNKVKMVG